MGTLVTRELDPDLIVILPSAQRQVARTYGYLNSLLACKDDNLGVKRCASRNEAYAVRASCMSHCPRIRRPDVSICNDGNACSSSQTGAQDLGFEERKVNVESQKESFPRLNVASPFLLQKHRKGVRNLFVTSQVPQLLAQ